MKAGIVLDLDWVTLDDGGHFPLLGLVIVAIHSLPFLCAVLIIWLVGWVEEK